MGAKVDHEFFDSHGLDESAKSEILRDCQDRYGEHLLQITKDIDNCLADEIDGISFNFLTSELTRILLEASKKAKAIIAASL